MVNGFVRLDARVTLKLVGVTAVPRHPNSAGTRTFSHEAFFYNDTAQFVRAMTAFLRDGIANGEPALVVVDPDKIDALRSSLGADADAVGFADMRRLGGNPGRIISIWEDFVTRSGLERRLRGIGEPVWPGRSDHELPECHQHESLLNLAFPATPMRLVCPYDARSLPSSDIEKAMHTHPLVLGSDGPIASDRYQPPGSANALDGPLSEPVPPVGELAVGPDDLGEMRRFVFDRARLEGLDPDRSDDLTIAVNELATNTIRHGSGKADLRCWTDGGSLVVEIHDGGVITDPLVGRRFPSPTISAGRGLWLVNQLCDLVQLRSSPSGTTVRVHMCATR